MRECLSWGESARTCERCNELERGKGVRQERGMCIRETVRKETGTETEIARDGDGDRDGKDLGVVRVRARPDVREER